MTGTLRRISLGVVAGAVGLLGLAVPAAAQAQAQAADPHVAAVLAQLDAASQRFKSARADFSWDYYEAVVKDTSNQSGAIYFERQGTATQMGAVVIDPKTKRKDKILEYKGGTLQMFDTGVDQIRLMKSGQKQAQYESFLTLGFGGSGRDLARAWDIKSLGTETLSDDGVPVKTEKLDLTSKDAGVRNMFTHITIWLDPARGVSLKQIFETPSHDRRTALYTHIKLNTAIDKGTFAIKKGPHTTVVQ